MQTGKLSPAARKEHDALVVGEHVHHHASVGTTLHYQREPAVGALDFCANLSGSFSRFPSSALYKGTMNSKPYNPLSEPPGDEGDEGSEGDEGDDGDEGDVGSDDDEGWRRHVQPTMAARARIRRCLKPPPPHRMMVCTVTLIRVRCRGSHHGAQVVWEVVGRGRGEDVVWRDDPLSRERGAGFYEAASDGGGHRGGDLGLPRSDGSMSQGRGLARV